MNNVEKQQKFLLSILRSGMRIGSNYSVYGSEKQYIEAMMILREEYGIEPRSVLCEDKKIEPPSIPSISVIDSEYKDGKTKRRERRMKERRKLKNN